MENAGGAFPIDLLQGITYVSGTKCDLGCQAAHLSNLVIAALSPH